MAEPHLDLGDGRLFAIDSSWNEHLDFRRGKEKGKWVASKAKEVFQDFKKAKDSFGLLNASSNTSVIPSGAQIANARDSSHSGFSSPPIYESPENLASSSRATLLVASKPDKQRLVEAVLDEGDGAVNRGHVHYVPVSSPSPVTEDFIEPKCSSLRQPESTDLPGASPEDFTEDQEFGPLLDYLLRSEPDSVFNANGHPQCSAVNATANEQMASLFEPDEPCSPVVEENQGSYAEAAIPDKMSLDITTVPVEGALPNSQGHQSLQDGMDVGAPLSDPRFCSELSIEDHLLQVLQKCENDRRRISELELERENDKRRISELEREVKRLKGKSPMRFDA